MHRPSTPWLFARPKLDHRDLRPILPFDQPERASIELACDLEQMFGEVSRGHARQQRAADAQMDLGAMRSGISE
jgi:hypothetical protein